MGICHSLKAKILVLFELTFTKNFKFLELHGHLCGGHKQMLPMKMENSQTHGRELKLGYLVTNLCSSSIQTGWYDFVISSLWMWVVLFSLTS